MELFDIVSLNEDTEMGDFDLEKGDEFVVVNIRHVRKLVWLKHKNIGELLKFNYSVFEDLFTVVTPKDKDCESCGNYIDKTFENPNCSGCSKNPFYINCFTLKTGDKNAKE